MVGIRVCCSRFNFSIYFFNHYHGINTPASFYAFLHQLGWTHIAASWPFYLIGLMMVFTLFLALVKRINHLNIRYAVFSLNHLGLIVILLAGGLGKSDYSEMTMTLKMDEPVWYAKNSQGGRHKLDFALEMTDFDINYYLPVIQISDNEGEIVKKAELDINKEARQIIEAANIKIVVRKVLEEADMAKDSFREAHHPNAVTAAKITVNCKDDSGVKRSWISSGSKNSPPQKVEIGDYTIRIQDRIPKVYQTTARL